MFKITNILNPLTGGSTTTEHKRVSGHALSDYMGYSGECIVSIDGGVIKLPLSEIYPTDKEEYIIMPIPEGGDKQTLSVLGTAVMGGLAIASGLPAAPLLLQKYGRVTALVGGVAISLLTRDKSKGIDSSRSYQWEYAGSPLASHGTAMPIIYGKARVRPTLKNRYVTVDGDKQTLYALYSLAAHKVNETTYLRYSSSSIWHQGDVARTPLDNDEPGKTYRYKKTGFGIGTDYLNPDIWEVWRGTASFNNDIIVNGRAITEYNRDVEWETRPGLPDQAVITDFDVTYSSTSLSQGLYLDYPQINKNTAGFDVDSNNLLTWVDHDLLYRGTNYRIKEGYYQLSAGMIGDRVYIIWDSDDGREYQKTYSATTPTLTDTQYIVLSFEVTAANPFSDRDWPYTATLPTGDDWYYPAVSIEAKHNVEIIFEFPNGLYGTAKGTSIVSDNCRLFAQYRIVDTEKWLNFNSVFASPDHDVDYSDSDIKAIVVTRKKPEAFNISLLATDRNHPLDEGEEYEIRVASSCASIVNIVHVATMVYGQENDDGSYPGFTYPGEPLLGIKALASGQISGDLDVQIDVERSYVWVRDGTNLFAAHPGWNKLSAKNHAWAVYDILANGHPDHPAYPSAGNDDAESIYGCGLAYTRIDYDTFKTWADYLDGEDGIGYELNIVFDSIGTAWDAILRICIEGRGMIYPAGTKLYAFVDKAEDVSQLFTMGNIQDDTLVQKYVDSSQKINMLEANYWDAGRNYEKTTIAARTSDWDTTEGLSVPETINLYGTTDKDQAWSQARFILMGNELLDNAITFGVDVDSLASRVGDVIEVQHDVLAVGEGGRVVKYEANLCQNPSFESGALGSKTGWTGGSYANTWDIWGAAASSQRRWSTDREVSGNYSYYHIGTILNTGIEQEITGLNASTNYTLSCYVYPTAHTSLRIMTYTDDYHPAYPVGLNAWERLEINVTTEPGQTTLTVWIGGVGSAYFDAVQLEEAAVATDWMQQSRVTLDKDVTLAASGTYDLRVWREDAIINKTTALGLGSTTDTILFSSAWSTPPEQYDSYAFGLSGFHASKYRITDISRTHELMRMLTLRQYDEDLYESYTPNDDASNFSGQSSRFKIVPLSTTLEEVSNLLNLATNLKLREVLSKNKVTGEITSTILATWDTVDGDPRGSWEVWFRDVDASDDDWEGSWIDGTYDQDDKVEHDGKTYISLKDLNTSEPFSR